MRTAISRDLDCADSAATARRVLTRGTDGDTVLLAAHIEACLIACERGHEECSRHAQHHGHCRLCAQATATGAESCRELLAAVRS